MGVAGGCGWGRFASVPVSAQDPAAPVSTAVIQPGDVVRINVWRKPELSGEFQVTADGTIADPFYMAVNIGGLPLATASERVRAHLARYETDPRVLVEPLFRVVVGGEVRQPNLYTLRRETTIAQAVMLAGGPTERGNLDRVRVLRDGEVLSVDILRPEGGLAHTPIRSGDQILVGRRRSIFRDYILPATTMVGAVASVIYATRR